MKWFVSYKRLYSTVIFVYFAMPTTFIDRKFLFNTNIRKCFDIYVITISFERFSGCDRNILTIRAAESSEILEGFEIVGVR